MIGNPNFRPPDPAANYNVVILKTSVKSEPGETVSVSFNRLHIFSNARLSLGVGVVADIGNALGGQVFARNFENLVLDSRRHP